LKTVIFAGVILILIIMSIVFANFYILQKVDSFKTVLNDISRALELEDWEQSMELIETVEGAWDKLSSQLAVFFNHGELRDMGVTMASLKTYIMQNEKTEAMAQVSILSFGIKHITEKDSINIKNIF